MTIRQARFDDYWRKVQTRPYEVRYEKIQFEKLICLGNGEIEFKSGITAIVGGNGVGKSTLVAAIGEFLGDGPYFGADTYSARISGSENTALIAEGGVQRSLKIKKNVAGHRELNGGVLEADCRWVDPAFIAHHIKAQIAADQNFLDILEPVSPTALEGEELQLASYIVGKNYSKFEIFEIDDYADFSNFVYFRVTESGVVYGSEAMGQGELSLLLVFSTLRALKEKSILVLEEPETHVSPRAQIALMNVLAKFCAEKAIWAIVTTHSPIVISRLPSESIRLLLKDGEGVAVNRNPQRHELAAILGGGEGYRGVILVEDELAKNVLLVILEERSLELARQFEIVVAKSKDGISSALRSFPKTQKWLSVIGVYDGDMRGQIDSAGFIWPFMYFPMHVSPEIVFQLEVEKEGGIANVEAEFKKERQAVLAAREAAKGLDPHDWLVKFGETLGMSRTEFVRGLVRIWLKAFDPKEIERFIEEIKSTYNRPV